jgi:Ca2+-binding RTX toxin-like protein
MQLQGMQLQGMQLQGMQLQGMQLQGMQLQGMQLQGMQLQGMQLQGMQLQGMQLQGMQLQGVDRLRSGAGVLQFRGLSLADVQVSPSSLQGLQSGGAISYVATPNPGALVRLQAGPGSSGAATAPGNFIYVEGMPQTVDALKGTFWNMVFADSCATGNLCTAPATCVDGGCIEPCTTDSQCTASGAKCVQGSCSDVEGRIAYYIADVRVDTHQNSSKYAGNEDIYLYTVYYRQPGTEQWSALCPLDYYGDPTAMAVPIDQSDWQSDASRAKFTFACNGSGVAAKCARNWGYKPWKSVNETVWNGSGFVPATIPMQPLYNACIIAARADYCQDEQSYTKNGTTVDLFDTLDGFTSINPTVGLPYAPYSPGVMLHEEYQISALDLSTLSGTPGPFYVSENYTPDQLMSMPADQQALVSSLRRSGMESSRYGDLDPGRSCAAAPYTDRCDPTEPYDCYRAANMASQPYGAFIALNSPRHCSHDEDHDGEPLDPLCNECVNRVCQVDPTCCGDPGSTFYPGSLVWDSRCSAIRQEVCKSSSDPTAQVWRAGVTAMPASSHKYEYERGAIGSFEGITTDTSGNQFAEGWACDPDFPGTPSPVQISVGGDLGAAGATLYTATADQPLATGWREAVAAECGGPGPHGFRFQLPAGSAGKDVFVYGIDLNVPGAPFTLLRGGDKTVPSGTPVSPQAAIWTGWVQPPTSGSYTFSVTAGSTDLYRLWVNGVYVAGNWVDPDPTVPSAFELSPPYPWSPATFDLIAGVRYPVRIEYMRPASLPATSHFQVSWNPNSTGSVPIPSSAFYPMGQGDGSGLLGNYFAGILNSGTPQAAGPPLPQTVGAVDYLWTSGNLPAPGLSVDSPFAATFQGQVVAPVSGDYTFTADTDGVVQISVAGQLVTAETRQPTGFDPATCSHDLCQTGAAISRTCPEGFFCSGFICNIDPRCCSITWDATCEKEVATVCGFDCRATPPVPVTLTAGQKYDISVTYQHQAGGAKLHLMWALPGVQSAVIPAVDLFATPVPGAAAPGVGINAAYFSDGAFQTEYLDHVEAAPSFDPTSPPVATRTTSMICTSSGCGAGGPPGIPVLTSAQSTGTSGAAVTVTVTGGGASSTAMVDIWDGTIAVDGSWTPTAKVDSFTVPVGSTAGGTFTRTSVMLPPGAHQLAVQQTVSGQTSLFSDPLAVFAADPAAPPSPTVTVPSGGLVSGNGKLQVGGTAAPNSTVTVTAGTTSTSFVADGSGNWGGLLTLPGAGSYNLSIVQTVGGVSSAIPATATANVLLPPLTVTSPANGATVSTLLQVTGSGADPSLGGVIIADGDGRYFEDRGTATVNPSTGAFSGGNVSLDYGLHQLKIFQRANGLDGAGVTMTVSVPPPSAGMIIGSPLNGAVVDAAVHVLGTGGLPRVGSGGSGLPGTVIVYEGTTKVGEARRANDGSFDVPVTLTGVGPVTLTITQTAASLSGAGSAESAPTLSITVILRPGAPVITQPVNGLTQTSLSFPVAGTGVPGSTVALFADGFPVGTAAMVDPTGAFSTSLTLTNGTHSLTATQTLDTAESHPSAPVVVTLGDTTPPNVVSDQRQITVDASSPTGASVDFSAHLSATDNGVPMPASAISCLPPSGSQFVIGSTDVSCQATDAAGNRGSTVLTVTVRGAPPTITGSNLTAEAQGPSGAVVGYSVSATGYTANCAPPGSGQFVACSAWHAASKGIGFLPDQMYYDPTGGPTGTLYSVYPTTTGLGGVNDPWQCNMSGLVKSSDRGATWQKLTDPPGCNYVEIYVKPTTRESPASIYYVSNDQAFNVSRHTTTWVSSDGGQTWTIAFPGHQIVGMAGDPADPNHMLAWPDLNTEGLALWETHDGWQTMTDISDGLVSDYIDDAEFDPLNSGRIYVSEGGYFMFRKVGAGSSWERLGVPPYPPPYPGAQTPTVGLIYIAPNLDVCRAGVPGQSCAPCPPGQGTGAPGESCQTFPTIFTGLSISRDGGNTWVTNTEFSFFFGGTAVAFDPSTPGSIYARDLAWSNMNFFHSTDGGLSWTTTQVGYGSSLIVDVADPKTVYTIGSGGTFWNVGPYASSSIPGPIVSHDGGATWAALPDAQVVLNPTDAAVYDVAPDPLDPTVAYLVTDARVMKSTTGGDSWFSIGESQSFQNNGNYSAWAQIQVDPLNRNNVYLGGVAPIPGQTFTGLYKSPDAGGHWVSLPQSGFHFAIWPTVPDTIVPVGYQDVRPQIVPSSRTIIDGFTYFSVSPRGTDPTPEQSSGVNYLISDHSDGVERLYADGYAVFGDDNQSTVLYRALARDLWPTPHLQWEQVASVNGDIDFSQMVIDPGSGGQSMYTLSIIGDAFWESHDGGHTWAVDPSAPSAPDRITKLWTSPLDGALYALVYPYNSLLATLASEGMLWKRSPVTAAPPGTPVAEAQLRPTCTGGDGLRGVGPGATFPLGNTTLTCTATDVFGQQSTQTLTIKVQDTTPPVITVPTPMPTATAPSGQGAAVTFDVNANDAVAGSVPVICTPASGSTFPSGVSTVTCTAADTATPAPNVATASFQVLVTDGTVAYPTITTPGDQTVEAQGPNGATVSLAVTAQSGAATPQPLPVSCTPGLDQTFPIGTTTVTCSATDGSVTATQAFHITVQDTTPPTVNVPADMQVAAQGASGAPVTYTASANDLVDGAVDVSCSPPSGATFGIGSTRVACRATDHAGHTGSSYFTITVADVNPPVLQLADMIGVEAQDSLGAMVIYSPPPSATDVEDGTDPVECLPASGSWFPLGVPTTVVCVAADSAGHETRGSFQVLVVDTTPPVVTAPATITVEASGSGGVTVPFQVTAADSVDGGIVPSCTRQTATGPVPSKSGDLFPLGDNLVTCVAGDRAGNVGSSSFEIVVRDTSAPTLTVPANIATLDDGTGTAVVTFVTSASDTVSGGLSVSCTPPSGSRFAIGVTTVTCTTRDGSGNTTSKSFTVTVGPNHAPTVTVPGAISKLAPDSTGIAVSFTATANDADTGPLTPVCTWASGAVFPVGITTVTCTATDPQKLSTSASFTVTVVQNTPPVVTVPGSMVLEATSSNGAVATFTASANDAQDGSINPTCTPASGSTFPVGMTTVTCSATDILSAKGTASFTVQVQDTTPPVLNLPAPISVSTTGSTATVSFTVTATDLVSGPIANVPCTPASGSAFPVGMTTVTCTAQDAANNIATRTFAVTVIQNTPPVVTVPAAMTVEATSGSGAVAIFAATASDAQDGPLGAAICTPASGSTFPLGATTVNCSAKDSQGAIGTASFKVTVSDTTPPVLSLPAPISVWTNGSTATVTFSATATDLVSGPIANVPCTPASGSAFPVGTTTVTCTAQDPANNTATRTFAVTVMQNTPPVITVPAAMTVEATSGGGAVVTFTATATDAQDGPLGAANCTPASGSTFTLGTTTVSCKATDSQNATGMASFAIKVQDTTPPKLTVPGNLTATAGSNGTAVVTFSATATDAVTTSPTVTCAPASGTAFAIGTTTVSCFATDGAGNKSATGTFTVTVSAVPLALKVPADLTISVCANANIGTATSTGGVSPVTITSNKPATFALGTTTVTYTAKDASGKTVTGTQKVTAMLGDDASCCPAGTKVIKGTSGKDTLKGTTGSDCILGLGGDDVINGNGGNDYISGGAGNDTINAGTGNDVIYGGDGNDVINGGGGNDTIYGGAGNDTINTGSGNDIIDGGDGTDTCNAGSGQNTLTSCEIHP